MRRPVSFTSVVSGQLQDRQRDDLRGVHQVVDAALFVRLVREIEDARAVGDAVRDAGDASDVLLVVGARAGHETAAAAEHAVRARGRAPRRRASRPACAPGARPSGRAARSGSPACRARRPSSSSTISALVASKPSSSRKRRSNTARQGSATHGVWMPSHRLAAVDAVDVQRRVPRAGGTTGTAVVRAASRGCSSRWMRSRTTPMCSIALTPRNGMLPCAMRPRVCTSNQ